MGPYGPKTTKADVKELIKQLIFVWHWLRVNKWMYITAVKTSE